MDGRRSDSEVFIHPGDHFFGSGSLRLRTILGSCIAVALWHPQRHLAGFCHFMLPSRMRNDDDADSRCGLYADWVLPWLAHECLLSGTRHQDYRVRVLGGGCIRNTSAGEAPPSATPSIGDLNIDIARQLLSEHHFCIADAEVGGAISRDVSFDLISGELSVRWISDVGEWRSLGA